MCIIILLNSVCNISEFPIDVSLPFFVFAAIMLFYTLSFPK